MYVIKYISYLNLRKSRLFTDYKSHQNHCQQALPVSSYKINNLNSSLINFMRTISFMGHLKVQSLYNSLVNG